MSSVDSIPLARRVLLKRSRRSPPPSSRRRYSPSLDSCARGEVATFTDAVTLANEENAAVALSSLSTTSSSSRRCAAALEHTASVNVSARYDPSIVYAVDETLTRGAYSVLARWFCSYANKADLPGCVVVMGYGNEGGESSIELGADCRVPRVTLTFCLDYPIFELKRYLGYPVVIILITLHASRLGHDLSCDGRIDIHPRNSMQRSVKRVADALSHVVERYLTDLFYDEKRAGAGAAVAAIRHDDNDDDDATALDDEDARSTVSVEVPVSPPPCVEEAASPEDDLVALNRRILCNLEEADFAICQQTGGCPPVDRCTT